MDIKKAQEILSLGLERFELQSDVTVHEIKGERWILAYDQNPAAKDFGRAMIRLEGWIRARVGEPVELMLGGARDKNKRDAKTGRLVSARGVMSLE